MLVGGFVQLPGVNQTVQAASRCYNGARKFIHRDSRGEDHHIVEFDVDVSAPDQNWYISKRPSGFSFSSSIWPGYYNGGHKWLGYQWAYNWWDPYSPSSWQICLK
jgi:hypothetical protein